MLRGSVCLPVHKKKRVFRLVYNMDLGERSSFVQVLLVVFFKRGESGGEHLCVAPLVIDWPGFGTEEVSCLRVIRCCPAILICCCPVVIQPVCDD